MNESIIYRVVIHFNIIIMYILKKYDRHVYLLMKIFSSSYNTYNTVEA